MNDRPELRRSLIGRAGEITALSRAIQAARAGHPTTVLVEGAAGIGKTALVEHVLQDHHDLWKHREGHDPAGQVPPGVLRVAGVSWEADLPLGIAHQLIRAQSSGLDPTGPAAPRTVLDAGLLLHRQWSARQEREPLTVVVDDAHWADPESLRAMRSALRRMSTERVLVVLIAREDPHELHEPYDSYEAGGWPTEPSPAVLAALEVLDGCREHVVRPGPLTPQDVRSLARDTAGLTLDLPAARQLCHHTRGNPRHVTRLLRELPHETWQDRRCELPAPARCATSVRHRLARCGQDTRALVEACAVLGEDALLAEAAVLAGIDTPLPALDEARAAGLLTATVDPGRALLTFAHPLVRAAVLTGIGLTRRAGLHARAAEITEDRGRRLFHRVAATTTADGPLADELDRHATERAAAGEWSAVADTLVRAGRLSTGRAAREDRLLRAVDAMIGAGDVPRATAFAAELESFPADTPRDAVLGYLAIMRGRPAEADAFLTQAWKRCDPERHRDLMARICQRRVLHALGRWDGRDLVAWARRAIELADPEDPSAVESKAVLGLGLAAVGRPEEALAAYDAAAAELPGGAQPQRFQLGRGWVDLALDAPEAARRRLEAAVPTGYRMGSTRISLWAQGWLARTQFALGVWPDALETAQRAVVRLTESGIEPVRPLIHWTAAQIHALRGDWETADRHAAEAAADLHHYEVMLVPSCLARAQVAEARGDYERVIEALAPVVQLPVRESIDEPGFWPWPDMYANALALTGRLDEADAFLTPHEARAARRGRRSAQARLGLARGRLTAARGDIDTARRDFEQALAHLDHLPLPYDRARVNFAYGQTLRRAGKRREADTVLKNARDAYATLGARTYVERCERELQAGGVHTARTAPGLLRLTPQERAVAGLVAAGATNQQTALELFISVKTVQYHLTNIYSKLGIRSRSELAARFRESPPTG
ncbi:helix-turn-helix transcriptional regulator [Streptomyces yaizuensis]|uniref:LuxR family transcriptional regulator n=1 Tax=Streptomyces yaizuensis TaxID=2989713 RepID=A0ABQ5NYW9_9ACTN|nr:AAA family ATPase [Streptomyces sp. YSPA8]GLF95454.1 LuxR family transcriptional regulator [Streptomyces sp. YSPA8]